MCRTRCARARTVGDARNAAAWVRCGAAVRAVRRGTQPSLARLYCTLSIFSSDCDDSSAADCSASAGSAMFSAQPRPVGPPCRPRLPPCSTGCLAPPRWECYMAIAVHPSSEAGGPAAAATLTTRATGSSLARLGVTRRNLVGSLAVQRRVACRGSGRALWHRPFLARGYGILSFNLPLYNYENS